MWTNVNLSQVCSHFPAGIRCMYVPHTYVSLCLSLRYSTFFSSSVCQSVRPSVCISPSWQPACLHPTTTTTTAPSPPPSSLLTVLFAAKWLLSRSAFRIFLAAKNAHIALCVFLCIPCWADALEERTLEVEADIAGDRGVSENGSIVN